MLDRRSESQEKVSEKTANERGVLERYGLRWAVLAAWENQLRSRGAAIPQEVRGKMEEARIKISSGCFSSCEVGCVLGDAEGALTSVEGSRADADLGTWTDLLARTMSEKGDTDHLFGISSIKVIWTDCGFGACRCAGSKDSVSAGSSRVQ
jgi:hypothetical protein